MQRVLRVLLNLSLSTMSAEGQGNPKVTKLWSSYHDVSNHFAPLCLCIHLVFIVSLVP